MFKNITLFVAAAIGIYGYYYSWPFISVFLSQLTDAQFFTIVPIMVIASLLSCYCIYILIDFFDKEHRGRRIGDVKIEGEILDCFINDDMYFSTEDRLSKK